MYQPGPPNPKKTRREAGKKSTRAGLPAIQDLCRTLISEGMLFASRIEADKYATNRSSEIRGVLLADAPNYFEIETDLSTHSPGSITTEDGFVRRGIRKVWIASFTRNL